MSVVLPCTMVRFACRRGPKLAVLGMVVRQGDSVFDGCVVAYARPRMCMVSDTTTVQWLSFTKYRIEELEKNYLIEMQWDSYREYYVYPKKVWNTVYENIIEPMSQDKPPRENGVFFYGPPGTGKTSMINIIANINALEVVTMRYADIASPYIGKTTHTLQMVIENAKMYQPSIIKADDIEWLAGSRKKSALLDTAAGREFLGMFQYILDEIENMKKRRDMVVFAMATNFPEDVLDEALLRGGRVGLKIQIPRPNEEAVRVLLELLGVRENIDSLVARIITSGLSMSEVVTIAETIRDGKEPNIRPKLEAGYVRPVAPRVNEKPFFRELMRIMGRTIPCHLMGPSTRIFIPFGIEIAEPLLVLYMTYVCRRPAIILTSPPTATSKSYYEAMATAEVSDGVLVVDADMLDPPTIKEIHLSARVPVFYVSSRKELPVVAKIFPSIDSIATKIGGRDKLLSVILDYYGIAYGDEISSLSSEDIERLMHEAKYYKRGSKLSDIMSTYGILVGGRWGPRI